MTTAIMPSSPAIFCSHPDTFASHDQVPESFSMSIDPSSINSMPPIHDPLIGPSPLGLTLRKTPSLLELISSKLSQDTSPGRTLSTMDEEQEQEGEASDAAMVEDPKDTFSDSEIQQDYPSVIEGNVPTTQTWTGSYASRKGRKSLGYGYHGQSYDKKKASNFPCSRVEIGSWERIARFEGELVMKCYYAKRKLVWEVLENGLKSKVEIQWGDISAIRASCPHDAPGILELELARPPLFFEETNPQPRKHTLWQAGSDFTDGQSTACRLHKLTFPEGALNKPLQNLIDSDPRLRALVEDSLIKAQAAKGHCTKSPPPGPRPSYPVHWSPPHYPYSHSGAGSEYLQKHHSSHNTHYATGLQYNSYDEVGYGYNNGQLVQSNSAGVSGSSSMTEEGCCYSYQHLIKMEHAVEEMQPYCNPSQSIYSDHHPRCESCTGSGCSDEEIEQSRDYRNDTFFDPMDLFSGPPVPTQDYGRHHHEVPLYLPGPSGALPNSSSHPISLMPSTVHLAPEYLQAPNYYWEYPGHDPVLDYRSIDEPVEEREPFAPHYGQNNSVCSTTLSGTLMSTNSAMYSQLSDDIRQAIIPPESLYPLPPNAIPSSSHGSFKQHGRNRSTRNGTVQKSSPPTPPVSNTVGHPSTVPNGVPNGVPRARGRPRIPSPPFPSPPNYRSSSNTGEMLDPMLSSTHCQSEQLDGDGMPQAAPESFSAARVRLDVQWEHSQRARGVAPGRRGWANEHLPSVTGRSFTALPPTVHPSENIAAETRGNQCHSWSS